MLKLLGSLREFVKREPVTIDGFVFRLHVSFTTAVLFGCSLLVTASQFVGNPIQCIVDSLPYKPVNTYCWISSTFTMPDAFLRDYGAGYGAAHPGVGPMNVGRHAAPPKYYTYYQWVCFALFLQAVMCYAPKWVWDLQEGALIKTLVKNLHLRLGGDKEKQAQKKLLVHYMVTHIGYHTWYVAKYWMCEAMCLVNIVFQIFMMNKFFGGEFFTYGLQVIGMSTEHQDDRMDPMVYIFPRATKCTFHKFGPSGTLQTHDSLCILPLNIINEKTYIFLWFWYLLLLVLLLMLAGFRISMIYNKNVRKIMLQCRCRGYITEDVAKAVTNKVTIGDWWLLYMLGKNMDPAIYREVMRDIAKKDI